ncbi:MAG TPA: hypothetical protein VFZ65_09415 [Planctomycetota bacterium]|nr:hypothetical protein [Planctomycetota bacterium]
MGGGPITTPTTAAAAAVLLTMGIVGGHTALAGGDLRLGFGVALGPWLLFVAVMFVALVTGRQP